MVRIRIPMRRRIILTVRSAYLHEELHPHAATGRAVYGRRGCTQGLRKVDV